jgi:integrase
MISVSFYLLTPDAITQSLVYASISNKEKRLRFSTGESFITDYCNVRKKKGTKTLVKRNTAFYFEYTTKLTSIRDSLIRLGMELTKDGRKPPLELIREAYYLQSGKTKPEAQMTLEEAFNKFISGTQSEWSDNTLKKINGTLNHLKEFQKLFGELILDNLNEDFWYAIRDNYFVLTKKFSNPSTNKYLKTIKQFLRFIQKKNIIKHNIDLDDLKYLDELEPFKIALNGMEVEKLLKLNLSADLRLDKVRDLFALEILTGQRFSDIPKVLDRKHFSETSIQIYQQKTGEKVTIPLHYKLKKHLAKIANKYPDGFPSISNQKFNEYVKEIGTLAGFDKEHSWVTMTGKKKIPQTDYRYNLITSHTGRRTFCTLALKRGIHAELIMKVTGHRSYDQFREYVKVDDSDLSKAFEGMFIDKRETAKSKPKATKIK